MRFDQMLRLLVVSAALVAVTQPTQGQTIPASRAAPPGAVNTGAPGFNVRIVQAAAPNRMTAAAPAESLIGGTLLNSSGQPEPNIADLSLANPDGTFTVETVINFDQGALPSGAGNFPDDDFFPGIPGTTGNTDNFVMEVTGWLDLPAGTIRFGVNSDDGFKLTIGTGLNPRDPFDPLQLAILDGTRGQGNTEVNITVSEAGLYPFRLLYWENSGDARCELYTFAPGQTSGTRYLVNDLSQPNAIRSYRELVTPLAAAPTFIDPPPNPPSTVTAPPRPYIRVFLEELSGTVNLASALLTLNDTTPLDTTATRDGSIVTIAALSPQLPRGSTNRATLTYSDSGGATQTNTWQFVVANYAVIPASMSLASVDTSQPGFKARVFQYDNTPSDASQNIARGPGGTGLVPNAERQLAMGYNNPDTGEPWPNTASSDWIHPDGSVDSVDGDGFFIVPTVINWNEAPAAGGSFPDDDSVPGIPGDSGSTDRYVVEIQTILELKAGAYRLGVNSDDGFRLSAGWGPDVTGIELGTAGDRGFTDTLMDFVVEEDGFYPFRLMYFETGGGSGAEFFVSDLVTAEKTLINADSGANVIKAYRASPVSRPYVSRVLPAVNDQFVIADMDLIVEITNGALPVDPSSISLTLNGSPVDATPTTSGNVTTIRRPGSVNNLLGSGVNNVELVYGFTENGSQRLVTNTWSFTVPPYTRPIPVANRVPPGSVDMNAPGFRAFAHQIDRTGDGNQGNGGRYTGQGGGGNNMPRPEIQLSEGYINRATGEPYENLAQLGFNPDGSHDIPEILNFNGAGTANSGIFNGANGNPPDVAVPGLPGSGSSQSGLDNFVQEITMYLDLKAGAHLFGVNVDDGFVLSSAPNPHDTLGTYLGSRNPGGGNSGSLVAAAALNVIVPEDGIYPFRLLWWQGGGGVNLEFFHVDRDTGQHILINDLINTARAIPAYSTYTGPARPWVRFSVYPMPSLWHNQHQQSGPGPIRVAVPGGNPADIANDSPAIRPFGDSVGAIVADLGNAPVGMILDGVPVTPEVTPVDGGSDRLVLYTPPTPLDPAVPHTAGLIYADTTNYWTFNVIDYVTIPSGVAATTPNTDAPGFRVKVAQAASSQPNTVARAEAQLADDAANVAIPGPGPDGTYIITNIINWSERRVPGGSGAEIGNFIDLNGFPDEAIPGLPGTGLSGAAGRENVAAEIFAWLELPAGYQKFGVNGDDGWAVKVGLPGETDGTVLFSIDRGAGARDIPFAFVTPEAGLYPIRLVWYQGGGGGNLEFFSYGPNNEKIPINDRSNPAAIRAYREASGQPARLVFDEVVVSGDNVTLTWTGTGTLQEADSLAGAATVWTDVTPQPTGNTYTVSTTGGGMKFYRLRGE